MFQKTIKKTVLLSGVALHSGKSVNLRILSSGPDSGIEFIRTDISGNPSIKASVNNVSDVKRGTNLAKGRSKILTVEHILSALSGMGITNAKIELDGPEPPVLDGSAKVYVVAIKKAGIKKQNKKAKTIYVKKPITIASGNAQLTALPFNRFAISFMINYPGTFVGLQTYNFDSKTTVFETDIAPARTYGFIDEIKGLRKAGLIKGVNLKNAIAITDKGYLTKLRYKNELVRHKVLDMIGDLALTGCNIRAHIIGLRSGHELNVKLARKLLNLGGKKK